MQRWPISRTPLHGSRITQLNLTYRPAAPTIHPMYIITRYVIWEVLKLFLAALVALTLVVTLGMGVKEGFSRGLPAMVMMRTMPFMLPEMLGITLPAAMLFSVSSVFGRMTGANEVIALKSLGISPMAVIWPAIVLAAFISLGTVWMYEIAATWCKPSIQRLVAESIEDIALGMLQRNRSYDSEQFTITVKRVDPPEKPGDPPKLIRPTIIIKGGRTMTLTAAEAVLYTKDRQLWIEYSQSEVDIQGRMRVSFPGTEKYSVPIVVPDPPRFHRDWVAMSSIRGLIAELQTQMVQLQTKLRQLERLHEASTVMGLTESSVEIDQTKNEIAENNRLILRLKTEPFRRWANGFTCLCFALIGMPVAMLWRHADVLTNFFVCFLPILALYYPLLMLGEDLSTSGKLPPISFWTGNAVLTIPAIFLIRRIVRH